MAHSEIGLDAQCRLHLLSVQTVLIPLPLQFGRSQHTEFSPKSLHFRRSLNDNETRSQNPQSDGIDQFLCCGTTGPHGLEPRDEDIAFQRVFNGTFSENTKFGDGVD